MPIAQELARWGVRHLWSPPKDRELVDVHALLRLLPALLEETSLPDGSLEAAVTGADPIFGCTYHSRDGRLQIDENARNALPAPLSAHAPSMGDRSATRIDGDRRAWIAALGPTGDRTRLQISGDETLARLILDALPGPTTAVCHNEGRDR